MGLKKTLCIFTLAAFENEISIGVKCLSRKIVLSMFYPFFEMNECNSLCSWIYL